MENIKSSSIMEQIFEPEPVFENLNELFFEEFPAYERSTSNELFNFEEENMSKIPYEDTDQLNLPFGTKLSIFRNALEDIDNVKLSFKKEPLKKTVNEFELSFEIALAAKNAIEDTEFSRDQVVDEINAYFGRTEEAAEQKDPACRRPLTISMLNNYLSAPAKYPMPTHIYYAIMQATRSMKPACLFAESMGGKVVSGQEIDSLTLGKLSEYIEKAKVSEKILKKRMGKKRY